MSDPETTQIDGPTSVQSPVTDHVVELDAMSQMTHAKDRGSRRNTAVLITGAGGEVGHGLIDALHNSGREDIVALDIREMPGEQRDKCQQTLVGDICDAAVLTRLLAQYEITEIYHLAALLSTRSEFTPETAHEVNVGGTINLLRLAAEQARSHGQRVKFIFPSSIAVFGLPDLKTKAAAGRVTESQFCTPHTMYGCNKLYCEALGDYYAKHYRLLAQDRIEDAVDFRSVRYPGLISAETVPAGGTSDFIPEMIHAAAEGVPYACFVREDTRIPFMTMPDAIDAILTLSHADRDTLTKTTYNIASFNPSAGEVRDRLLKSFPNAEITFEPDVQRQSIVDSWPEDLNDDAARTDWGFAPKHDLQSAFDDYLIERIKKNYA